jgi:hypothetical protein
MDRLKIVDSDPSIVILPNTGSSEDDEIEVVSDDERRTMNVAVWWR